MSSASARSCSKVAQLDSSKGSAYAMLDDALLELGDYGPAERAYKQMERLSRGTDDNVESRRARFALLRGDNAGAARHFSNALTFEANIFEPSREATAWYQWQFGETAFATGDYQTAQTQYQDVLLRLGTDRHEGRNAFLPRRHDCPCCR